MTPMSGRPAKRVIVIGAGLAGLCAAYELGRLGHDVEVLEAQLRPGGRVLTIRAPFAGAVYGEAGAARIPPFHDITLHYIETFGLKLTPFHPAHGDSLDVLGGQHIPVSPNTPPDLMRYPVDLTPQEQQLGDTGLLARYLLPVLRELGDVNAPDWPPASLKRYDALTMQELLIQRGASPDVLRYLGLGYVRDPRAFTGSALQLLRSAAQGLRAGPRFKIEGGNDLLPRAFAATLSRRIHYGAAVFRIEQSEECVWVHYTRSGETRRLAAECVICAVPFGGLSFLQFTPRLSEAKRRALSEMRNASAVRGFLLVHEPFWKEKGLSGFARTDFPSEIWYDNFERPNEHPLLTVYIKGEASKRLTAMTTADRDRAVLDHVDRVFPGAREHVEGVVTHSWDTAPWAGGAYIDPGPGQMTSFIPALARPEGRIHFAGDYASPFPRWMQGALLSGRRAAREIDGTSSEEAR